MTQSPLVGLLQNLQMFVSVSLAHPLKIAQKSFMSGFECGVYGGEITKSQIKKKLGAAAVKSSS